MVPKYKLSDVAKDFRSTVQEVSTVLEGISEGAKKPNTVLTEEELNVIFEYFTSQNAVSDFNAYFASASAKPALVFPKLIRLAQNHLNKVKYPVTYNKLIGEIMDGLNGEFPETLRLTDQGRFDVGYYQQNQDLWKKSTKSEETEEE